MHPFCFWTRWKIQAKSSLQTSRTAHHCVENSMRKTFLTVTPAHHGIFGRKRLQRGARNAFDSVLTKNGKYQDPDLPVILDVLCYEDLIKLGSFQRVTSEKAWGFHRQNWLRKHESSECLHSFWLKLIIFHLLSSGMSLRLPTLAFSLLSSKALPWIFGQLNLGCPTSNHSPTSEVTRHSKIGDTWSFMFQSLGK